MCQPDESWAGGQGAITTGTECPDGKISPWNSLISRLSFCSNECYNLLICIKTDTGSERLFFILLDWCLHKQIQISIQTNKHARVSTHSELRFRPDYIFQPDIRETWSRNNYCLTLGKMMLINCTDLVLKYRFHCNTKATCKSLALKRNC